MASCTWEYLPPAQRSQRSTGIVHSTELASKLFNIFLDLQLISEQNLACLDAINRPLKEPHGGMRVVVATHELTVILAKELRREDDFGAGSSFLAAEDDFRRVTLIVNRLY